MNKAVVEGGNFKALILVMCFVGSAYKGYPLTSLHNICTSVLLYAQVGKNLSKFRSIC